MALSDHKITDAAIAEKGVVAAPDQLSGSARTNKMLFDRLIREAVKADYNGLIDALMAATGAGEIGAAVDGLTGATIQAILNSIKTALDSKISSAVTEAALELKSDKAVTNTHIKSVELDEATGTFTFTRENGTKIVIDTALEKVAVNFTYDEDSQSLILTLADGSTETVSLAAFVTTMEFEDSGIIEWSVSGSKVKATVKEGSITDTMLSSALKAMLLGYVNRAATSATNAAASEKNAAASAAQAREAAADTHGFMAEAGGYAQDAKSEAAKAAGSASAAASRAGAAGSSATRAAASAASAAESIKHAPRINSDGKWELWDATKNAYVATEYTAIGEDGTRGRGWYEHKGINVSSSQGYSWYSGDNPGWIVGDFLVDPSSGNVAKVTGVDVNADGSGVADYAYQGTLKGAAGADGITPTIGTNGNWYIGDTDTGVKAAAEVATHETAGIVKPDYDFDIAADGTLSLYKAMQVESWKFNGTTIGQKYINFEKGTKLTGFTFGWTLNKEPVQQILNAAAESPEAAIDNMDIGSTARSTDELTGEALEKWTEFAGREYNIDGSFAVTLSVKAVDGRGASSTAVLVLHGTSGVYTGAAAAPATIDSAFIRTLTKSLQSGKSKTFTVNAAAGEYIWYACPTSYGAPNFNVGGFDGGFSKVETFNFTNSSGYTEEYQVWRSDNAGLGSTTVVVS